MSEFYVTVWDAERDRKAKLAGPFGTHQAALDVVEACRKAANDKYPESHWYYFGTAQVIGT
jgi:hypothetical protein